MKSLSLLLFIISFNLLQAGNYLQIKYEDQNISYPPGTAFELYDSSGKLLYTNENLPEEYSINVEHKLVLHPNWRKDDQVYTIKKGTLLMKPSNYSHKASKQSLGEEDTSTSYIHSNSVSATQLILPSLIKENSFNLTLTFNDGFIFNYQDGGVQAFLNGEDQKVEGHYIITTEKGTYKISFDPSNGETWWVFEQRK